MLWSKFPQSYPLKFGTGGGEFISKIFVENILLTVSKSEREESYQNRSSFKF